MKNTMRRFLPFLCLFLTVAPTLAAGNIADVQIYDRAGGRTLPVYESGGRWFVAGKTGNEYQGTVCNCAGGDLLAGGVVDGGKVVPAPASAASANGYLG